ncbi:Uncharacterised protein [Klebsiella pneumoniae]|nr:Uncharacterised protein [Klebsiella pneumoniae]
MPGGGCVLPGLQPQITTGAGAAETAGAGGLNIAETFPEGRGSPHGCGLRAVFCRDAASARPEACRDKSKAPRSGDVAGRSPGVQGAAATGRPLCAPSAMSDIAQKKYWERNLSGNNIEVVALPGAVCTGKFTLVPLFRRVAAGALPGLLVRLRLSPGPASNCAAGRWHQARSCVYAGWRLRLTRPTCPAPTVCRPGKHLSAPLFQPPVQHRPAVSGTDRLQLRTGIDQPHAIRMQA